jgi:hypothetical protein
MPKSSQQKTSTRPPKDTVLSKIVTVRVTLADYNHLKQTAKALDTSVQKLARRRLLTPETAAAPTPVSK